MNIDPKLREIADKVEAGVRLGLDDGMLLSTHPDLLTVGQIANLARERLHGNVTYYNRNLHLNTTNVCEASCAFCSFARLKEGMPSAYTMDPEQALEWIEKRYQPGMTEVHIVNGLNPHLPFSYYTDLLRAIRARFPALHLKAFTAVEIHYFAQEVRHVVSRGAGATDRRRPRFPAGRRGGDFRPAGAKADLPRQGRCRRLARHPSHGPPVGAEVELHDALRHDRNPRGADRPPSAAAGVAGRDGRFPGLRAAGLPSRGQPAAEARRPDGRRRPAGDRRQPADFGQHPAHQGLLDHARR